MSDRTAKDDHDPISDIGPGDSLFGGFDFTQADWTHLGSFIDMSQGGLIISQWNLPEAGIFMEFRLSPESMANALLFSQYNFAGENLYVKRELFVAVGEHGNIAFGGLKLPGSKARNKDSWEDVMTKMSKAIGADGKIDEKAFTKLAEQAAALEGNNPDSRAARKARGEPTGARRAWLWLLGRLDKDECVDPIIYEDIPHRLTTLLRLDLPAEMASGPGSEVDMERARAML